MKTLRLLTIMLLLLSPAIATAEQYRSGNQVVHTRLAPVVVHRVFPPYTGIHIYNGGRRARR